MKKLTIGKLTIKTLFITIIPLVLFGLATMLFTANWFKKSMNEEVRNELKNIAVSTLNTYDLLYPGDYSKIGTDAIAIVKGEYVINSAFEPIDYIKANTGIDISIFYDNLRVLTTLRDSEGNRLVGTFIGLQTIDHMFKTGEPSFYTDATDGNMHFYAYYYPIFNSDNTVIGMIAVVKPLKEVNKLINKAILPILVLIFIGTIIVGFITVYWTQDIINLIIKLQSFLAKVANGDLDATLSPLLTKREDEFGAIARSSDNMKNSLKGIIDNDFLTGLNNRRGARGILSKAYSSCTNEGLPFTIAMGDIDHFKKFNDTYGHDCGDIVLQRVALEFKKCMVGKGYATRWGGEEFMLIFTKADYETSLATLHQIVENIRNMRVEYEGKELSVTITMGILECTASKPLEEQLIAVDDLLYKGKQNGRDQIFTIPS